MNEQYKEPNVAPMPELPGIEFLDELTDDEVIEHFLSELRHPSVSRRMAEYINKYTSGRTKDELNVEQLAWYDRLQAIRFSVGYSNLDWDNLVDETSDRYDVGFTALTKALQDTRENKSLQDERQALLALLDLRIAAINRGLTDAAEWQRLAEKLVGTV